LAKAVMINPKSVGALNNFGVALTKIGEEEKAIRIFNEALKLGSSKNEAFRNLKTDVKHHIF
jgi:Flp pilus assembly protein TadD